MDKIKNKYWFLIEPIKQISYGMAIYVLFAFFYNQAHAGFCVTTQLMWGFATSTTSTRTQYSIPVMTGTPNNGTCAQLVITGAEYTALLNSDTTNASNITTANNNITTVSNTATSALNIANGAQSSSNNTNQYLQNTLIPAVNTAQTTASDALTLANQVNSNLPSNNPNNILNISNQDAQTLMYAILGLFVIAFVGRMYRKSVSIADSTSD